jgi:RNA polymerase sigma-70 factor (ECF subfamily)
MPEDRIRELYRLYGPVIFVRCRRMLRDDAAAEDATQETFVRVYRHLDRAPDADEALSWIYRIATNLCLNELRNRKHRPEFHENVPERAGQSIESTLENREIASRLIERAPDKLRAVAWLHYVDGMDQEEVARVMGITRRTVFNRIEAFRATADKLRGRAAV